MNTNNESPVIPAGYTPWSGGDHPGGLPGDTVIWPLFRSGAVSPVPAEAGRWRWDHNGGPNDIIAYRVESEQAQAEDDAKDAARFRWLRDNAVNVETGKGSPWCVYGLDLGDCTPTYGAELVAMVDYAMEHGVICSPAPVESLRREADDGVKACADIAEAEYDRARKAGATDRQAWHAAFEKAQPSQQGEAVQDEVEAIGAVLFRDWDNNDRRDGGAMEYHRGVIRDFISRIRQPGDIRVPTPAEPLGRDAEGVEGLAKSSLIQAQADIHAIEHAVTMLSDIHGDHVTAESLLRVARRLRPQVDEAMALARGAWRAGITLGNNICVQESDRENDQDGDSGWINGTAECAKRIREWVEPDDTQLLELLAEAGVDVSALTAALTEADSHGK